MQVEMRRCRPSNSTGETKQVHSQHALVHQKTSLLSSSTTHVFLRASYLLWMLLLLLLWVLGVDCFWFSSKLFFFSSLLFFPVKGFVSD